MSIRVKLIAVVFGVMGSICALAMVMLLSSGPGADERWRTRLALTHANETYGSREHVRHTALMIANTDAVAELYVVESSVEEDQPDPKGIWDVRSYWAQAGRGAEVEDQEKRDEIIAYYREVTLLGSYLDREDVLAVIPINTEYKGPPYTLVAIPHDRRAGVQALYVVMVVGIVVLAVLMFWLISKYLIRPLRELATAADRIAEGDYSVVINARGSSDELGRTINAFNRMAHEMAEYQGHLEDRVLTALTRIKKAEQHLAIAQRLAATGKLAAGLAHEINNPLGGMKNALRSLARGDLSAEKTAQYLDLVADGLGRVEQTVKKFLTFTPRRVEPRPADLALVVSKSLPLAMHRIKDRDIELVRDLPEPGVAMVFGDDHELQQVTLNLVLNAADAIKEGSGRIEIRVSREDEEVRLQVIDNGAGMSAEDQDRCFDMFFTTKDVGEGTGLGLAVVHNIVTNHGGRIEVTSAPGEGAAFTVILPVDTGDEADGEAPETAPEAASEAAPGTTGSP